MPRSSRSAKIVLRLVVRSLHPIRIRVPFVRIFIQKVFCFAGLSFLATGSARFHSRLLLPVICLALVGLNRNSEIALQIFVWSCRLERTWLGGRMQYTSVLTKRDERNDVLCRTLNFVPETLIFKACKDWLVPNRRVTAPRVLNDVFNDKH